MSVRERLNAVEPAVTMSYRQLWMIGLIGVSVGVGAWLLGALFDMALFRFIFCREAGLAGCTDSSAYANATGLLLATGIGVWALVRVQAFRPLLIGVAAAMTLWGVLTVLEPQPWYIELAVAGLLFGLTYMAYGWIMRLRSLVLAVILGIVLLIVVRLVLYR